MGTTGTGRDGGPTPTVFRAETVTLMAPNLGRPIYVREVLFHGMDSSLSLSIYIYFQSAC